MRKILFPAAVLLAVISLQSNGPAKANYRDPVVVSYAKDIAPIMKNSCAPCHFPPDGRKEPLDTYEAVSENIGDIIKRVKLPHDDRKFMPKGKDPVIVSDSLIVVLETWQKQNMPK